MNRLAVIGHPVAHSLSPAMQNAALAALGLDDWEYGAIDLSPEELDDGLAALPSRGYRGVNVTVPHKLRALALATEATDRAAAIGAANTLTFDSGAVLADNTDAPGLIGAVGGVAPGTGSLVLGAGGSARAAVWALRDAGATVTVWNRTPERATELCRELGGSARSAEDLDPASFELVVNSTAAGLEGEDALQSLPVGPDSFRPGQTVIDLVYGERPSAVLAAAAASGARVIDGLEMLLHQGALSLEIWTGRRAPLPAMRAALRP